MAIKDTLCTIQDVRNLSEYITTEVRDDARVRQFIIRADSIVRDALRPYYTIDTELEESATYNGPPQAPYAVPDQDISANSGSGALSDVTLSSSAKAEVWTVTFSNSTAFSVSGSSSGSQGSGKKECGELFPSILPLKAKRWAPVAAVLAPSMPIACCGVSGNKSVSATAVNNFLFP